jgi:hypothetical protein
VAKQQRRKPPKRAPAKEIEDDDALNFAAVLTEHVLDNTAEGWFVLPWRDGWNAVELAIAEAGARTRDPKLFDNREIFDRVSNLTVRREISGENYHCANDLMAELVTFDGITAAILRAGLRCYQILVARSDGGGMIYNEILRPAFAALAWRADDSTRANVLHFRCRDAIGVYPSLMNDHNDRLRRAFCHAWKAGLYHAAYAIAPAR